MFWVWLVVIQLFIFTMLVLFLRVLLTRNVSSATAHLHELNQDYNEKVDNANKKKAEVDRYYDELLLKAKGDAEKQKVSILREAQATQEAVIKDARRQGEEIIAQANKVQELAMAEIDNRVAELSRVKAGELLNEVLTEEMNLTLHELWIKELFKTGFEDIDKLHLPEDAKEIVVESAFALTDDQRNFISKKIQTLFGKNLPLVEEIKPSLGAGIKIALGSVLIDGCLESRIREVSRHAKPV
jgi:F0F1-type ATP synthase membrane subunit b/b'